MVCIILVNYNGWHHTIDCLEGLYRSDYRDFRVLVVDNGSTDGSLENIGLWADGMLDIYSAQPMPLTRHPLEPAQKPLRYTIISPKEHIDNRSLEGITLISSMTNLGFAGANNLGISFAMSDSRCRYLWLLNNDTVPRDDALSRLVLRAEELAVQGVRFGILGSKLLLYDNPERINAIGGRYYKWIGFARQVGMMEIDRGQYDRDIIDVDYVAGASMFVTRDFVADVGPLCEDYFLYYEELDWVCRGRQRGWTIAYCPDSTVYHKEGATIGSSKAANRRSKVTDYYAFRNRLLFTKRFYPYCLPTVLVSSIMAMVWRALNGNGNIKAMIMAVIDGLRGKRGIAGYV